MKRVIGTGAAFALLLSALSGCGEDKLIHSAMGTLKVTVVNAGSASLIDVTLRCTADSRDESTAVATPSTLVKMEDLGPGTCQARVMTRDAARNPLRSIWVSDLLIAGGKTTEVTVDMGDSVEPQPVELCNGIDDDGDGEVDKPKEKLLLCSECVNNLETAVADDSRCEVVPCGDFFGYELRGSVDNGFTCVKSWLEDITDRRCAGLGACLPTTEQSCRDHATKKEDALVSLEAGERCQEIQGCAEKTAPTLADLPDGTDCGVQLWCQAGECVCKPACDGKRCGDDGCGGQCGDCGTDQTCDASGQCVATAPEAGCADGSREGFQDRATYPTIASCSGGFSVGGVTRADLVPTCNRQSGNDGTNQEGTGCSAADLCAAGWHVCKGHVEVAAKAGTGGCTDSVPAGTPDKAMFFAVQQNSAQNSQCDDTATTGDNDVFGCGNLGIVLTAAKNCGVLTRALASTQAGKCGYTEAEPTYGPWQCLGDSQSHYHEGGLVTKSGCPGSSCTWDGSPVGNWDRGGVLCCKD